MDEVKQTGFRLPPELLKRVKLSCIERGTKQTEAVIAGLELWLGQSGVSYTPKRVTQDIKKMTLAIERASEAVALLTRAIDDMDDATRGLQRHNSAASSEAGDTERRGQAGRGGDREAKTGTG